MGGKSKQISPIKKHIKKKVCYSFLCIITWNGDQPNKSIKKKRVIGFGPKLLETEKLDGFIAYLITYVDRARGGTAVSVKENISHIQQLEIKKHYILVRITTVRYIASEINIGAV